MVKMWDDIQRWGLIKLILIIHISHLVSSCSTSNLNKISPLDRELKTYIDNVLKTDNYNIFPGVSIRKLDNYAVNETEATNCNSKNGDRVDVYFKKMMKKYADSHYVTITVPETSRFFRTFDFGKSSFLTGFGMGFLAKLLLPVFLGAQIIKSVLLALFLPSIIGNVGKLLGKGLSSISGNSGSSGFGHGQEQMEDFEFKDTSPYNEPGIQDAYAADSIRLNVGSSTESSEAASRFGYEYKRVYQAEPFNSENYYYKKPQTKSDYKVFHQIPSSSLLLTSYDPFYSPLLSRLDVVFQQLGLGNDKSPQTERCRERLVCMMYANPAKYAPYSNLVSAQLSRELNELRRPSSDNPEILRFFRYMKAARDGQDGEACLLHASCPSLTANRASPAMLTTFNDINKLVQARKFK